MFLTGHTGFKGSWLSTWLIKLGAEVTGYALAPNTQPSMFTLLKLDKHVHSIYGDVRDLENLSQCLADSKAEIFIHLAAQPLVRQSYKDPVETYSTNVMGTVSALEAVRQNPAVKAFLNVTTDKCYQNNEWVWPYRETDRLGGKDPYSNSKACSELITQCYRDSFFPADDYPKHQVAIATARAGNVIGGGDWAEDRLIPDVIRAFQKNETAQVRNPQSIRPWQHVLEPLSGYLLLAEQLIVSGEKHSEAWNFGPSLASCQNVEWLLGRITSLWKDSPGYSIAPNYQNKAHESAILKLDHSKATDLLNWQPIWSLTTALEKTIAWYQLGAEHSACTSFQIDQYQADLKEKLTSSKRILVNLQSIPVPT